jgi:hypothetical protein
VKSASTTKKLVGLARKEREISELKVENDSGEIAWTKLATVARVMTPENASEWIERAKTETRDELERRVKESVGEKPTTRATFEFTEEEFSDVWLAIAEIWHEMPHLEPGAALAEFVRRQFTAKATEAEGSPGSPAASARPRIVVTQCDSCKKATRETREGSREIPAASVERLACDAEIVKPNPKTKRASSRRAVPPSVARYIDARDKNRCRVPECRNTAYIERHHNHTRGWRAGHSPTDLFLLCSGHHAAHHDGHLRISGNAELALTFTLADGSPLPLQDSA